MRTTIKTMKTAKKVCLELWDRIEKKHGESPTNVLVGCVKSRILKDLGYENLGVDCPMCEVTEVLHPDDDECETCPLNCCESNGYSALMTGREIKRFNKFLKEKLS